MQVIEVPVSIYLPPPKTPRSEGIHVSNIIRCIAMESGLLKRELMEEIELVDVREITDPVAILRINIGLAWEAHYIPMLPDVIDHPGEMEVDGIYMTHDGESVSVIITSIPTVKKMAVICHEVKATYKSTRTVGDLRTQWMWLAQVKAYCRALNTRFAMIHVLFICGDYSYPITPLLKCWQVEFSEEEITDNWDLLKGYRDYKLSQAQFLLEEA